MPVVSPSSCISLYHYRAFNPRLYYFSVEIIAERGTCVGEGHRGLGVGGGGGGWAQAAKGVDERESQLFQTGSHKFNVVTKVIATEQISCFCVGYFSSSKFNI